MGNNQEAFKSMESLEPAEPEKQDPLLLTYKTIWIQLDLQYTRMLDRDPKVAKPLFILYDTNDSGAIDTEEAITRFFCDMYRYFMGKTTPMTEEFSKRMATVFDPEHTGYISFDRFFKGLECLKQKGLPKVVQ